MEFRELARAHNQLAGLAKTMQDEHKETRVVLTKLLGHWNGFVQRGFWGRLRWFVSGQMTTGYRDNQRRVTSR